MFNVGFCVAGTMLTSQSRAKQRASTRRARRAVSFNRRPSPVRIVQGMTGSASRRLVGVSVNRIVDGENFPASPKAWL